MNFDCLAKTEKAGTPMGEEFTDKYVLRNMFKTDDIKLWGIQFCTNPTTDILSSFRIYTALDYG